MAFDLGVKFILLMLLLLLSLSGVKILSKLSLPTSKMFYLKVMWNITLILMKRKNIPVNRNKYMLPTLILPRLLSWSMVARPIDSSSFKTRRIPAAILPIESTSDLQRTARCSSSSFETTASICKQDSGGKWSICFIQTDKNSRPLRDEMKNYRLFNWESDILYNPLGFLGAIRIGKN